MGVSGHLLFIAKPDKKVCFSSALVEISRDLLLIGTVLYKKTSFNGSSIHHLIDLGKSCRKYHVIIIVLVVL